MKMNTLDYVAWVLLVVGGLNWGLIGAFKYNLVGAIFGAASTLTGVIYILVGLSALYSLVSVLSKKSS